MAWAILFGFIWGFGNVTYGMANRYLGIALGGSIASAFACYSGHSFRRFRRNRRKSPPYHVRPKLSSVAFCFACSASHSAVSQAGAANWNVASTDDGEAKEFNLAIGLFVAVLAGVLRPHVSVLASMPASRSRKFPSQHGTDPLYTNNVVLIAVLTGGFLSNALCCLAMNLKNRTLADYIRLNRTYLPNALLAWLSGVTWFCQFFFSGMGQIEARQAV